MTGYFIQAFIFLFAAVVMVPLARRLGLGSVLGYLIAGVIIGPVTGLVGQETNIIQHFAEFGVVMMLFLVGLELQPRMLWEMRNKLLGLGGLQVGLTTLAVCGIAMALGVKWTMALAIGLIFSLSSTAIVLQTFNEKGLTKTEGGNSAFSVLLFQDIAVIPMLALMPLLALPELQATAVAGDDGAHGDLSLVADLPGWATALVVVATVAGLVLAGHFLSRPLFRYVADSGLRETFTATALMLVIGIAALMGLVGLSPALGTFLAGVVLANSEFRHELEANIEPFKGLLLGLFFITVGAGVNFTVLEANLGLVVGLTLGLMLLKVMVLLVLAVLFRVHYGNRWLFGLSLAQAGEFGFVLLGYAVSSYVLPEGLAQILAMVVALSMFLTPLLFIMLEKVIFPRYAQRDEAREPDAIDEQGSVIIAGIGRFGQIVNRLLVANGVKTIVLDHQASQVERLRAVNITSYYGDATRPDLLETAGIANARMLVVAIDDKTRAVELVSEVRRQFPHVQILARAYDRGHHYELQDAGADFTVSETYKSALNMGGEALQRLGIHPFRVEQVKQSFCEMESQHFDEMFQTWREEGNQTGDHYRSLFISLEKEILAAMQTDRSDRHSRSERGWTPPPKNYLDDFEEP
ncbi:monovalent cation:proton antiporter-2 (CPA2) family protein [Parendozoicomonas haliclonae]|uniref:Glutathione-regulated potassium-efflux system protein KefC n=1 Tax=Parendozoicomonas haliclonae TaxID=1960125 RepID=A0A1X7ALT2_9GAMM|nr:monovalent cation:proton antiporter-2 (CPA2) family protein [Parendozoicomonas haliclonae]SMA49096.1 Glutathione-regulated potassium-efflux system protein KefC [Parendozoicomonas haliclonae]